MNPPTTPPSILDTWLASLDHVQIGLFVMAVGVLMLLPGLVCTIRANLPRNQERVQPTRAVSSARKSARTGVRHG